MAGAYEREAIRPPCARVVDMLRAVESIGDCGPISTMRNRSVPIRSTASIAERAQENLGRARFWSLNARRSTVLYAE